MSDRMEPLSDSFVNARDALYALNPGRRSEVDLAIAIITDAESVPCPFCGAGIGELCRDAE